MKVQAVVLTERLLRAAAAVRFHREFIPCRLISANVALRACELVGAGRKPGTVNVRTWGDTSLAEQPVRIEEITLPPASAERLKIIAEAQI